MTRTDFCATCAHTDEVPEGLFCRYNPPQVVVLTMLRDTPLRGPQPVQQVASMFPQVQPGGWCSRHAPKGSRILAS